MAPEATPPRGKAMAVRCRPVKTRGYAISEAGGGAGVAGWAGAVCAGAGVWVAALARATCWRKVRRLVDIRYRVLWRAGGWGAEGIGTGFPAWVHFRGSGRDTAN